LVSFIFFFVKSRKYFYDLDAIREKHKPESIERIKAGFSDRVHFNYRVREASLGRLDKKYGKMYKATPEEIEKYGRARKYRSKFPDQQFKNKKELRDSGILHDSANCNPKGKNPGDFWDITTQPHPFAHFAVYPEKLCINPIKSSCPSEICVRCGFIREKIIENNSKAGFTEEEYKEWEKETGIISQNRGNRLTMGLRRGSVYYQGKSIGFTSCSCNAGFKPGVVLDIFAGAGTTCLVAKRLGRNFIGFELNPKYIEIADGRLKGWESQDFKVEKENEK